LSHNSGAELRQPPARARCSARAIKRRDAGVESTQDIGRSHNVSHSMPHANSGSIKCLSQTKRLPGAPQVAAWTVKGQALMFRNIGTSARIQAAKDKTERLVGHLQYLLALHENNAIIAYSNKLSSQIPMYYAANAFNVFQRSIHQFEIVRLCALWDRAGDEKENIPTIIKLIDDSAVIEALAQKAYTRLSTSGPALGSSSEDPATKAAEDKMIQELNEKRATEQANKAREQLPKTIADARTVLDSERLREIMNLRDKHIAHSLSQTHREKKSPVAPMKYGDERKVLEETLPIVQALYSWVNGIGFSFEESRKIEREYAQSLWNACTFKISAEK
jgi:AbiU2